METKKLVKGIGSIYIPVTDPERSANWYRTFLNLQLRRPVSHDQAQLTVSNGQTLFLIKTREKTTLNYVEIGGAEMAAITLEMVDLEAVHQKLLSGNERVGPIQDGGGCGLTLDVLDPDGNKLELWGGWPKPGRSKSVIRHASPIFFVANRKRTLDYYASLGFACNEAFGFVERDGLELIVHETSQEIRPNYSNHSKEALDLFAMVYGVEALYEEFKAKGAVFRYPLRVTDYGMKEFAIVDPDGYSLGFGESLRD